MAGVERPTSLVGLLQRTFRAAGLLLGLVVIANAAVLGYVLLVVEPALERAIDSTLAVRRSHEAMLEQDTALRGHLLTGEAAFLTSYQRSRQALAAANERMDREVGDDGQLAGRVLDARIAQQAWLIRWAEPASEGPRFAGATERRRFLADGRALFGAYQEAHDALIGAVIDERGELLARQRTVVAAAAIGVLGAGVALELLARRQRRRVEDLVVSPLEDLEATMRRIEDGDLAARAAGHGASEFARLAGSLAAMSSQLQAWQRRSDDDARALADRSDRLAAILTMARDVSGSLKLAYVVEAVADHAEQLAGCAQARAWIVHDDQTLSLGTAAGDVTGGETGAVRLMLGQGLVGEAARDGRTKSSAGGPPGERRRGDAVWVTLALPMVVGARVVGVLELRFDPPHRADDELLSMLELLCAHGATAIEAARLHAVATELSEIDALTGLYNRRRLDDDLAVELARSVRFGRPLSFAMLDVDHFKRFNDTHGHQRGDEALQELARVISKALRSTDSLYRYGGEELSLLLRETPEPAAADLSERLRTLVERHFASATGAPDLTVSIGVAGVDDATTATSDLVRAADRALYEAKAGGRNRVVASRAHRRGLGV